MVVSSDVRAKKGEMSKTLFIEKKSLIKPNERGP